MAKQKAGSKSKSWKRLPAFADLEERFKAAMSTGYEPVDAEIAQIVRDERCGIRPHRLEFWLQRYAKSAEDRRRAGVPVDRTVGTVYSRIPLPVWERAQARIDAALTSAGVPSEVGA
jgi:hypothetical protein